MKQVIIKPIISEKSMNQAGKGRFVFAVARYLDKPTIKRTIEKQFNVHIKKIMTITTKGKTKRIGTRRNEVAVSPVKKAVVQVKEGEKIAIFDVTV